MKRICCQMTNDPETIGLKGAATQPDALVLTSGDRRGDSRRSTRGSGLDRAPPPAPLGRSAAYQAVGEVAAPLLAGFSITLVGVIAQGPSTIRWPGAALLLLTVAAASLLFSVQAAFFGRQLYWTRADLTAWYSTGPPDDCFRTRAIWVADSPRTIGPSSDSPA